MQLWPYLVSFLTWSQILVENHESQWTDFWAVLHLVRYICPAWYIRAFICLPHRTQSGKNFLFLCLILHSGVVRKRKGRGKEVKMRCMAYFRPGAVFRDFRHTAIGRHTHTVVHKFAGYVNQNKNNTWSYYCEIRNFLWIWKLCQNTRPYLQVKEELFQQGSASEFFYRKDHQYGTVWMNEQLQPQR